MPAKNIAACGICCSMCPAYLATIADSDEQRRKVAEKWTVEFKTEVKPESVNCLGCNSEGPLFSHCSQCEIRKCAEEKNVPNCAHCNEFACSRLDNIFAAVPGAKDTLDAVHQAFLIK